MLVISIAPKDLNQSIFGSIANGVFSYVTETRGFYSIILKGDIEKEHAEKKQHQEDIIDANATYPEFYYASSYDNKPITFIFSIAYAQQYLSAFSIQDTEPNAPPPKTV